MDIISFVYILNICIALMVIAYQGKRNGLLPESFFLISSLLAGLAAEINFVSVSTLLTGLLAFLDPELIIALSYALLFIGLKLLLASVGLQIFTQLRSTPFIKQVNKSGGYLFAFIKAFILVSITIRFLYLLPIFRNLTEPVHSNNFVIFFRDIIFNVALFMTEG